jgi:hypothetical protein
MRQILFVVIVLCLAASAFAQDTPAEPATISLPTVLKEGQALKYKVRLTASGSTILPGSTEQIPLDITLDAVICYTVGKTSSDGLTPVTIAADKVSAVYPDRTVELTKDFLPQSVALIDKNGEITRIISGAPTSTKMPGINSANLIILFRSYAPIGDLKVGSSWKKAITLAHKSDRYEISYTLQGLDQISGVRTAKIRSEIAVVPPDGAEYSAKGFAISDFSVEDGRLVKSHTEITVKMFDKATQAPSTTETVKPGEVTALVKWYIQQVTSDPAPAAQSK